jgi:hypothetical protein
MKERTEQSKRFAGDRKGFVLPAIVFGLMLMSTMAVLVMMTAGDEQLSSRAMREAGAAFYAAEAGLQQTYSQWDTYQAKVDSLEPGDSLDLGWQDLAGGSRYRAVIMQWDNEGGAQTLYGITVRGRGPGQVTGHKRLSLTITVGSGGPGEDYRLGACCEAAVTVRGHVQLQDDTGLDGHDANPPGWGDACTNALHDKPGVMMQDTTLFEMVDASWMDGVPPLAQNADMSDATWDSLGDLAWADLESMADKTFHDGRFSPNPSTKVVDGETVCNTDDPNNLGSPDPSHPCFNYFPIVSISDDVTFDNGYAQGIFVLRWDEPTQQGSEFDLEMNLTVNGVILGKGCVEPEEDSRFYGAIFVDANYRNLSLCNSDKDYDMNDGDATVRYSTCAVDRAILGSGLDEWAEPEVAGAGGGAEMLISRTFSELFQ